MKAADQQFTGLQMSLKDGRFTLEASRKVTFATASTEAEGDPFSTIVPPKAVAAILTLADDGSVGIGIDEGHATFRCGNRVLIARTLIGQFPDFSGIIPEFTQSATVSTTALKSALQRTLLTTDLDARKRFESVKLTFTADALVIESRGGGTGKSDETIPITSNLNGEAVVFGAFGQQLLDWLAVADETGVVELNAPTMIRLSRGDAQYVVCGVTLQW